MTDHEHDPQSDSTDLTELAALPPRDADAATAERVRRMAADAFALHHETRGRPFYAGMVRGARALTPVLVVGTVGIYLAWAVSVANALYGR